MTFGGAAGDGILRQISPNSLRYQPEINTRSEPRMYPNNRYPANHATPSPNISPVIVKQELGFMPPPPPRFNQIPPPQFNQMLPPPPRQDFHSASSMPPPPPQFRPPPPRWGAPGPPSHYQADPYASRWGDMRPTQMGPPGGAGYQGNNSRPRSFAMMPPPRVEPPARVPMPPPVKVETPAAPIAPKLEASTAPIQPPLAAIKQEGGGGPCSLDKQQQKQEQKQQRKQREKEKKANGLEPLPKLKAIFGSTFEGAYADWRRHKARGGAEGDRKRAAPDEENGFAHVVFVVDGSASMRTCDAMGKAGQRVPRYQAVFECCRDFVRDQLQAQGGGSCDVYSMLSFKDCGEVLLNRAPLDNHLLPLIDGAERRFKPSHGTRFGPAFAELSGLVTADGPCPPDRLLVIFLSDGRPGDLAQSQVQVNPALRCIVDFVRGLRVADFTFRSVLVGDEEGAPVWLRFLADVFHGKFFHATLDARQHGPAAGPAAVPIKAEPGVPPPGSQAGLVPGMQGGGGGGRGPLLPPSASTLSSTFTSISRELTSLRTSSMVEQQRKRLRTARLEAPDAWQQPQVPQQHYHLAVVKREPGEKGDRVFTAHRLVFNVVEDRFEKEGGDRTVRVRTVPFAEGGLRLCFHMFDETPENGRDPGQRTHLVGKESRYLEQYKERLAFHRDSFRCHRVAESIARAFNDRLDKMNPGKIRGFGFQEGLPYVSFLKPVIYRLADPDSPGGFRYLAAEDHLEAPYRKYNGNNGYVLPATTEGVLPLEIDIPQAFSHFSYHHSNGKLLVCDLQGRGCDRRYTDPQVHSSDTSDSREGRASMYGKADLGKAGIQSFFHTHTCNAVCQALRLITPQGVKSGVTTQR